MFIFEWILCLETEHKCTDVQANPQSWLRDEEKSQQEASFRSMEIEYDSTLEKCQHDKMLLHKIFSNKMRKGEAPRHSHKVI